jgi:Protein of unknown function (DUF4239)
LDTARIDFHFKIPSLGGGMLYESFDSVWAPIIASFLWSLGIGVVSYLLVFKTKLFDHLITHPLVPPFLALPAIMFAFLMGFMSSDAWQNFAHARTALINEASSVSRLIAIPLQFPEHQKKANSHIQIYLEEVLNEEWGNNDRMSGSAKTKLALENIEFIIWSGSAACSKEGAAKGACIDAFTSATYIKALDDLRNAREQRLSLGYLSHVNTKWFLAIVLAFLSTLSVAAVHRHSQKTAITSLILFCCSIWVTFSIVTMYSNPYKWAERLEPVPLTSILNTLKSGTK